MASTDHSSACSALDFLRDELSAETFSLAQRAAALRQAMERAPDAVFDEDTAHKAILLAAQIKALLKKIEEARNARKDPIAEQGRVIDAHFTALADGLVDDGTAIVARINDYQRAIASGPDDNAQIRTDEGPLATLTRNVVVDIVEPDLVPDRFRSINSRALSDAAKDAVAKAEKAGIPPAAHLAESFPGVAVSYVYRTLIK